MIAIDPGAAGGIATGSTTNNAVAFSMPKTDGDIAEQLSPVGVNAVDRVAYLEDLVKYAGTNMPSSSMAVYASNWGFIKGVLTAHKYRVVLVQPKKWQAALGLGSTNGMSKTEWKNKLKNRAQQLYPHIKVTLSTADALLIYEAAIKGLL